MTFFNIDTVFVKGQFLEPKGLFRHSYNIDYFLEKVAEQKRKMQQPKGKEPKSLGSYLIGAFVWMREEIMALFNRIVRQKK